MTTELFISVCNVFVLFFRMKRVNVWIGLSRVSKTEAHHWNDGDLLTGAVSGLWASSKFDITCDLFLVSVSIPISILS